MTIVQVGVSVHCRCWVVMKWCSQDLPTIIAPECKEAGTLVLCIAVEKWELLKWPLLDKPFKRGPAIILILTLSPSLLFFLFYYPVSHNSSFLTDPQIHHHALDSILTMLSPIYAWYSPLYPSAKLPVSQQGYWQNSASWSHAPKWFPSATVHHLLPNLHSLPDYIFKNASLSAPPTISGLLVYLAA